MTATYANPTVLNPVRKGDVVAISVVRSITYAIGSGRGTERRTVLMLAEVTVADRRGKAKTVRRAGFAHNERADLHKVMTITTPTFQAAARVMLLGDLHGTEYASTEELKAAIIGVAATTPSGDAPNSAEPTANVEG